MALLISAAAQLDNIVESPCHGVVGRHSRVAHCVGLLQPRLPAWAASVNVEARVRHLACRSSYHSLGRSERRGEIIVHQVYKSQAHCRSQDPIQCDAVAAGGDWAFLTLPKEASARLPSRGQVSVECAFNDTSIQATLESDGQGGHWLQVDVKLRKAPSA